MHRLSFADRLNRMPPLPRLVVWLVGIAGGLGLVQVGLHLSGVGFTLFEGVGHYLVLIVGANTAAMLMAASGNGPGQYGFAISSRWARHLAVGFAAGAAIGAATAAYVVVAAESVTFAPQGWAKALQGVVSAGAAFPTALMAQLLFSGFILGTLLERYRPATSLLLTAVFIAAIIFALEPPHERQGNLAAWFAVRFFGLLTLAQLRLYTGDLALAVGAGTGGLYIDRLLMKAGLFGYPGRYGDEIWFYAPWREHLAAPITAIVVIAVFVLVTAWSLWRGTFREPGRQTKIAPSFKRIYPFGTMGSLAPLDVWLRELLRARFLVPISYAPRLAATLFLSALNTALSLPERLLAPLLLRNKHVPPPLFIIGMQRSGTTHLHNLLAMDPQFVAPKTYQVMNPLGFLSASWLLWPMIAPATPWRRPMDNVRFGLDQPNEDAYAIANASHLSPDWALRFPRIRAFYERFRYADDMTDSERRKWKSLFLLFLRKLCVRTKATPLLKNPYHSGRIGLLQEVFPDMKVVHIERDPVAVYRSQMHKYAEAHCLFELQRGPDHQTYRQEYLAHHRRTTELLTRDLAELPASQQVALSYDELIADPVGQLKRVYRELGLEWTDAFDTALRGYLESVSGYKRNRHEPMDEGEAQEVRAALGLVPAEVPAS